MLLFLVIVEVLRSRVTRFCYCSLIKTFLRAKKITGGLNFYRLLQCVCSQMQYIEEFKIFHFSLNHDVYSVLIYRIRTKLVSRPIKFSDYCAINFISVNLNFLRTLTHTSNSAL